LSEDHKQMLLRFIILLFASTFSLLLHAQICGVNTLEQMKWWPRYQAHLSQLPHKDGLNTSYQVPLAIHLVARTNGAGRVPIKRALEVVCELNAYYAPADISFYLAPAGFNLINDDGIFSNSDFAVNQLTMESHRRDSALNVFVVNTIGSSNVVGVYDSNKDWVLVQRNVFLPGNATLAHEIGHYFSLLHPHFGWDAAPWNINIHGNPAPDTASDGITPTERVDGSNCEVAGDRLCDTPPDYNLGLNWQQNCDYAGEARDPANQPLDPNERLIMGYFSEDCRDSFSEAQITLMQLDLQDEARAYLYPDYTPISAELATPATLGAPLDLAEATDRVLNFSWETVPAASHYYLEFDRSPDFNLDPQGRLSTSTSVAIPFDWRENTTYYWRVWAWNESSFCLPPSPANTFETTLVSSTASPFGESEVFTLNTVGGQPVLSYTLDRPARPTLQIYHLDGRLRSSSPLLLTTGKGQLNLHTSPLPAGLYLAVIAGDGLPPQTLRFFVP
jgi:hypothetical protein